MNNMAIWQEEMDKKDHEGDHEGNHEGDDGADEHQAAHPPFDFEHEVQKRTKS